MIWQDKENNISPNQFLITGDFIRKSFNIAKYLLYHLFYNYL